jgi:uncharacterized membrane protein
MHKGRLEAFSDGVIAIIITIMILELRTPQEGTLVALISLAPKFFSYALSFIFIGTYWNNHHHLWQASKSVNGAILWANLHLLFWLSLVPFVTGWIGETNFATIPVATYGAIQLLSGLAYYLLTQAMIAHHGEKSALAIAIGKDWKGLASLFLFSAGIALAFLSAWIAMVIYIVTLIMWLIPDRRIEDNLGKS